MHWSASRDRKVMRPSLTTTGSEKTQMNRHDKPSIKAGGWWLALLGLFSACDWSSAAVTDPRPEVQLNSISFISVVVDNDTQQADNRLKRFLESVIAKSSKPDATQRIVRFPQET